MTCQLFTRQYWHVKTHMQHVAKAAFFAFTANDACTACWKYSMLQLQHVAFVSFVAFAIFLICCIYNISHDYSWPCMATPYTWSCGVYTWTCDNTINDNMRHVITRINHMRHVLSRKWSHFGSSTIPCFSTFCIYRKVKSRKY